MNLVNPPPDFVEFCGERYAIHTDFRIWMYVDKLLLSQDISPAAKAAKMLSLCYRDKLPPELFAATELLLDFYGGKQKSERAEKRVRSGKRLYDFEQDAELFYAAFLQQYGMDLTKEALHWWKFLALFRGLGKDCKLCEVMSFRAVDLSQIADPRQKSFYRSMKRCYRLDNETDGAEADEALAELLSEAVRGKEEKHGT